MRDGGGVRAGSDAMLPLAMYAIQVAVHNVWPYVFFQKKHLAAVSCVRAPPHVHRAIQAAVWSSIHSGLSALTVNMFYRVNHMAGQLAVPALAWSAFCTYVCVKLYQLNKPPSSKKSS
jgi:tryptophan-rich sensory protein